MAFTFDPAQRERLLAALERNDNGAWHLTEDVERAIDAFAQSELGGPPSAAGESDGGIGQAQTLIAALRAALYQLPEGVRRASALATVADAQIAEIAHLSNVSGAALERLAATLSEVVASLPPRENGPYALAERFIHALGQAFRNRLNIKPTAEDGGLFRGFLDVVIDLTRRRHADLDELSRALTEKRLGQILGG